MMLSFLGGEMQDGRNNCKEGLFPFGWDKVCNNPQGFKVKEGRVSCYY